SSAVASPRPSPTHPIFPYHATPPSAPHPLSLHDALPILATAPTFTANSTTGTYAVRATAAANLFTDIGLTNDVGEQVRRGGGAEDRKSTRLNSSHVKISYAVFCLKKKTKQQPK